MAGTIVSKNVDKDSADSQLYIIILGNCTYIEYFLKHLERLRQISKWKWIKDRYSIFYTQSTVQGHNDSYQGETKCILTTSKNLIHNLIHIPECIERLIKLENKWIKKKPPFWTDALNGRPDTMHHVCIIEIRLLESVLHNQIQGSVEIDVQTDTWFLFYTQSTTKVLSGKHKKHCYHN